MLMAANYCAECNFKSIPLCLVLMCTLTDLLMSWYILVLCLHPVNSLSLFNYVPVCLSYLESAGGSSVEKFKQET